jgi:hypothetical protein
LERVAAFFAFDCRHATIDSCGIEPARAAVSVEIVADASSHLIETNVATRILCAWSDVFAPILLIAAGGREQLDDLKVCALLRVGRTATFVVRIGYGRSMLRTTAGSQQRSGNERLNDHCSNI